MHRARRQSHRATTRSRVHGSTSFVRGPPRVLFERGSRAHQCNGIYYSLVDDKCLEYRSETKQGKNRIARSIYFYITRTLNGEFFTRAKGEEEWQPVLENRAVFKIKSALKDKALKMVRDATAQANIIDSDEVADINNQVGHGNGLGMAPAPVIVQPTPANTGAFEPLFDFDNSGQPTAANTDDEIFDHVAGLIHPPQDLHNVETYHTFPENFDYVAGLIHPPQDLQNVQYSAEANISDAVPLVGEDHTEAVNEIFGRRSGLVHPPQDLENLALPVAANIGDAVPLVVGENLTEVVTEIFDRLAGFVHPPQGVENLAYRAAASIGDAVPEPLVGENLTQVFTQNFDRVPSVLVSPTGTNEPIPRADIFGNDALFLPV
ncbi:unnamed protein product [Cylindrotheca closterium]|uniref:DUF6824 domain-containing protein n=1 Tax=Cylindrotheca closterium TaxID=2856 RepID=A0AAD2JHE7_9STRA|nr:unnamed protein product [Cylindrotheca closterium]